MLKGKTMVASSGTINLTPYALAKISNGVFHCSESYRDGKFDLFNYQLYCMSIELGLKAAILSADNSTAKKDYLKNKIRHDLIKAYAHFRKTFPGRCLLDVADARALHQINPFFKRKSLEYFTIDLMVEMMSRMKNLPTLTQVQAIAAKVNLFLKRERFFISC